MQNWRHGQYRKNIWPIDEVRTRKEDVEPDGSVAPRERLKEGD